MNHLTSRRRSARHTQTRTRALLVFDQYIMTPTKPASPSIKAMDRSRSDLGDQVAMGHRLVFSCLLDDICGYGDESFDLSGPKIPGIEIIYPECLFP